jgi:hypothetical protein
MSYFEKTTFTPVASALDAFGRFRMSENYTIFDSKQILNNSVPLFWDHYSSSLQSASLIYNPIGASTILQVTGSQQAIRQSKQKMNYQPGKSQLILMTGDLTSEPGIVKRIGYYESLGGTGSTWSGVYFERSGSDLYTCIASNGIVQYKQSQSLWSTDRLDGGQLNPSGYINNSAASQIYLFDFEWLGVGNIRFGRVIDGNIIYVDNHSHANIMPDVTMNMPNLPCRYEIIGSDGYSGSMQAICSAVQTEGGYQLNGVSRGISTIFSGITTTVNALTPVVGFKFQAGKQYSSVEIDEFVGTSALANNQFAQYSIVLNPVTSSNVTFNNITNSTLMEFTGSTATGQTITGGTVLKTVVMGNTADQISSYVNTPLRLGSSILGKSDEIYLAVRSNVAAVTVASLNITEII